MMIENDKNDNYYEIAGLNTRTVKQYSRAKYYILPLLFSILLILTVIQTVVSFQPTNATEEIRNESSFVGNISLTSNVPSSGVDSSIDLLPKIHSHMSGEKGIFVNAYLVESANGVVVIDSALTVSESKALKAQLDSFKKPLLAVLLTHPHPDHVAGVTYLVIRIQHIFLLSHLSR